MSEVSIDTRIAGSAVAQAGRHLHHRGGRRQRPLAESAWHCEGRWQCDEQMDIWQCCDEVELDALREREQDEPTREDDE